MEQHFAHQLDDLMKQQFAQQLLDLIKQQFDQQLPDLMKQHFVYELPNHHHQIFFFNLLLLAIKTFNIKKNHLLPSTSSQHDHHRGRWRHYSCHRLCGKTTKKGASCQLFSKQVIKQGDGNCYLLLHYNGTIEEDHDSLSSLSLLHQNKNRRRWQHWCGRLLRYQKKEKKWRQCCCHRLLCCVTTK